MEGQWCVRMGRHVWSAHLSHSSEERGLVVFAAKKRHLNLRTRGTHKTAQTRQSIRFAHHAANGVLLARSWGPVGKDRINIGGAGCNACVHHVCIRERLDA